jgi:hypothetical protein
MTSPNSSKRDSPIRFTIVKRKKWFAWSAPYTRMISPHYSLGLLPFHSIIVAKRWKPYRIRLLVDRFSAASNEDVSRNNDCLTVLVLIVCCCCPAQPARHFSFPMPWILNCVWDVQTCSLNDAADIVRWRFQGTCRFPSEWIASKLNLRFYCLNEWLATCDLRDPICRQSTCLVTCGFGCLSMMVPSNLVCDECWWDFKRYSKCWSHVHCIIAACIDQNVSNSPWPNIMSTGCLFALVLQWPFTSLGNIKWGARPKNATVYFRVQKDSVQDI